jgi:thiol:disulfide interchange protein
MRPVIFLLIVIVAMAAISIVGKLRTPPELVPWRDDVIAALKESQSANKPVLLYFTASWCGPCQTMRRYVWSDQQVAAAAAKYFPIRVDVDQHPEIAIKYGAVDSVPVLMVLDSNGQLVRKVEHALDNVGMLDWLKDVPTAAARVD